MPELVRIAIRATATPDMIQVDLPDYGSALYQEEADGHIQFLGYFPLRPEHHAALRREVDAIMGHCPDCCYIPCRCKDDATR